MIHPMLVIILPIDSIKQMELHFPQPQFSGAGSPINNSSEQQAFTTGAGTVIWIMVQYSTKFIIIQRVKYLANYNNISLSLKLNFIILNICIFLNQSKNINRHEKKSNILFLYSQFKILSPSLHTMLTLSMTASSQKLFRSDYITLYQRSNRIGIHGIVICIQIQAIPKCCSFAQNQTILVSKRPIFSSRLRCRIRK